MKPLCWLILLFSLSANARVFSEDFSTETHKESSTLIWNTELGLLHPTLQVFGYAHAGQAVASQTVFSVGDGSDGPFEPSTYANFGTVVGNHITIDANQHPILKVTRFHLDATHTISAINGPLVIYSLSTVNIEGVIQCHGNPGGNAVAATGGSAGTGRCGGYSGGAGGNSSSSGSDGLPTTGNVTGGGGGFYSVSPGDPVSGAGGGGGASYYGIDGEAGFNSKVITANLGGAGGSGLNGVDHGFINLHGSAGGGGGCGSGSEGAGGGGAGGGTVVIHSVSSVTVANGGAILATGGDGGGSNGGGGGGGGGGGNIKVFTAATLQVVSGAIIDSREGLGANPTNPNAGEGGSGSFGRAWLVAGTYAIEPGTVFNSSTLVDEGFTGFVSGTAMTATSKSYDTASSNVTYQSIAADNPSSDISFQVSGSNDNFVSDDSGWINAGAISAIAKKRYIKYRISINNSDALNPTFVSDVSITYDPGQTENFTFKSGGCGLVKNPPPNSNLWLSSLLLFLPIFLAWYLRRPKTVQVPKEK